MKQREVFFSYLKSTNKNYLRKLAKQQDQSMAHCLEAIVEGHRLNRDPKFKPRVRSGVRK